MLVEPSAADAEISVAARSRESGRRIAGVDRRARRRVERPKSATRAGRAGCMAVTLGGLTLRADAVAVAARRRRFAALRDSRLATGLAILRELRASRARDSWFAVPRLREVRSERSDYTSARPQGMRFADRTMRGRRRPAWRRLNRNAAGPAFSANSACIATRRRRFEPIDIAAHSSSQRSSGGAKTHQPHHPFHPALKPLTISTPPGATSCRSARGVALQDGPVRLARTRSAGSSEAVERSTSMNSNGIPRAITLDVVACVVERVGIVVDGGHTCGAELPGRNREHARARPDVDHAPAGHIAPLQQLQTQPRRRVMTCAKAGGRVDDDDVIAARDSRLAARESRLAARDWRFATGDSGFTIRDSGSGIRDSGS